LFVNDLLIWGKKNAPDMSIDMPATNALEQRLSQYTYIGESMKLQSSGDSVQSTAIRRLRSESKPSRLKAVLCTLSNDGLGYPAIENQPPEGAFPTIICRPPQ